MIDISADDVVGDDPYFATNQNQFRDVHTKPGSTAVFRAHVSGYPEPIVRFYHDDQPIVSDCDGLITVGLTRIFNKFFFLFQYFYYAEKIDDCWSLTVRDLVPEDQGEYKAIASNRMGSVELKANLTVSRNMRSNLLELLYKPNKGHNVFPYSLLFNEEIQGKRRWVSSGPETIFENVALKFTL